MAMPTFAWASAGASFDSIARHGNDSSLPLQPAYDIQLALGQHFGFEFIDPELICHCLCGKPVVAGNHHHLDTLIAQVANCVWRGGFDGIGDPDQTGDFAVDQNEDDRLPLIAQLLRLGRDFARSGAKVLQ